MYLLLGCERRPSPVSASVSPGYGSLVKRTGCEETKSVYVSDAFRMGSNYLGGAVPVVIGRVFNLIGQSRTMRWRWRSGLAWLGRSEFGG